MVYHWALMMVHLIDGESDGMALGISDGLPLGSDDGSLDGDPNVNKHKQDQQSYPLSIHLTTNILQP